jgi:uncharacterized protein YjaZ
MRLVFLIITLAGSARPMLPALAEELRANADSLDKNEYAAFFYGKNKRPDIPSRSGYYVGYRVVHIIATGHTLQQLAAAPAGSI